MRRLVFIDRNSNFIFDPYGKVWFDFTAGSVGATKNDGSSVMRLSMDASTLSWQLSLKFGLKFSNNFTLTTIGHPTILQLHTLRAAIRIK